MAGLTQNPCGVATAAPSLPISMIPWQELSLSHIVKGEVMRRREFYFILFLALAHYPFQWPETHTVLLKTCSFLLPLIVSQYVVEPRRISSPAEDLDGDAGPTPINS